MQANKKTLSILIAAAGVAGLAITLGMSRATRQSPAPGPVTATPGVPQPAPTDEPGAPASQDTIQIALLLDTSGSMSGLINQARTQMWKLVNELGEARRGGARPRLELALYEYGKPSLGEYSGFIRQIVPLTDDLDQVSEELFALDTDGGDEYAGHVIKTATRELSWNPHSDALKVIFIAGNESFAQGPVDYRSAIAEAVERGIVVNTIYCGDADDPVRLSWQDGATLAMGRSLNIDQNQAIVHIAAPQDADIARLGGLLNDTYVGYGARGAINATRQEAQDNNAEKSGSMVQRSISKASAAYTNAHWDLVDGLEQGVVAWGSLPDDQLPDELRAMSKKERDAWVEQKRDERARLKQEIRDLNIEREKYVAARRLEQGQAENNTLDAAMLDVVRGLARDKGYELD